MRATRFRHRLELQELRKETAADGGVSSGWATDSIVWGQIEPLSGRELFQAQAIDARVTHRITIRHRDLLKPTHRIVARGRYFNIISASTVNERDVEISILAEERVT